MGSLVKDASGAVRWAIDWGARGGRRRLVDCQWRIAPDGLAVADEVREGSAIRATFRGGRPGAAYRVEARAKLSDGTILSRVLTIRVGAAA